VINQAPTNSQRTIDEVASFVRTNGLNLADTIVHNRLLYMTADNDGSVAQELKADGKEAEEIASLWANVKAALANKPAVRASAENSAFAYDPMGEIDRLMANLKSRA
jgi:hypothetical protein